MLDLIIKGIATGFLLSIMIGPVFFVLLETSIRKGVRSALALDLGVILSDIFYITIAYVFYSQVADLAQGKNADWLKILGGIVFIIYGIATYIKKVKHWNMEDADAQINNKTDYAMLGLKGFLLNMANPFVIFYWFSVMTLGAKGTSVDNKAGSLLLFTTIILVTFFTFDILKIIGAKKLRPLVTDKLLRTLNHFIGIVFIVFGIFLLFKGFF